MLILPPFNQLPLSDGLPAAMNVAAVGRLPVTAATERVLAASLRDPSAPIAMWDSTVLSVWCLIADAAADSKVVAGRETLPTSWLTVARRGLRLLLDEEQPSAATVSATCEPQLAERIEFAARARRCLLPDSLPAKQRQWLLCWANTWDAETLLGAAHAVMPAWWRKFHESTPAELEWGSDAAPAALVVQYLCDTLLSATTRFPRPLASVQTDDLPEAQWPQILRRSAEDRQLREDFDMALEQAKLEALKEFAYGASHELNNPLANIAGRAQALLADELDPQRRRVLATIAAEAFRAHDMIGDVMLVARPPKLDIQPVLPQAFLERVLSARVEELTTQRIALTGEWLGETLACADEDDEASPFTFRADPRHLTECLQLLIDNAADAIGGDGAIHVTIRCSSDETVVCSVEDDGPGIPPEIRPHIFEPYFSGREAGRGLGIGLTKCWVIARQHGGTIHCDSTSQRTIFAFEIPVDGPPGREHKESADE